MTHKLSAGIGRLAFETFYIGVSALLFVALGAYLLNTAPVQRLAQVPVLGRGVSGLRAVFAMSTSAA